MGEMNHYNYYNCNRCGKLKEKNLMRWVASTQKSGECKKCHSDYCTSKSIERKSLLHPEKYASCNDCDRTFHRFTSPWSGRKQMELIYCKFCGSKEIEKCE